MSSAVYPGSFDPITLGHLDIIRRGTHLVDRLVVGVTTNPSKNPMFTVEERMEMVKREVAGIAGEIHVVSFDSLLMDFAEREGASVIIRGLRALSDFEFEFNMALMNRHLQPALETLFVMPNEQFSYTSSTLVKQVAKYGGDVSNFVPPNVAAALRQAYPQPPR